MYLGPLRSSILIAALAVLGALTVLSVGSYFRPAEPAAAQDTSARKPVSACSLAISDTHVTLPFRECEEAEVTVTLGITCPTELPLRVVFVIGRHLLMEDHLDEAKNAARAVANSMPFHVPGTMAGVVSISIQERVEQEMTDSKSSVTGAIGAIRLDRVDPTTRYFDWLGKAQDMLEEQRRAQPLPALEAIILISTGCPTGFDSFCNRQVGAANKAKGADITVIGLCNPDARPFGLITIPGDHCKYIRNIASSGYYHDLERAMRVERDLADLMDEVETLAPSQVKLSEVFGPGLSIVLGSGMPAPREVEGVQVFSWEDVARGDVLTATYRIEAEAPGARPLRTVEDSGVTILDSMERSIEIPLLSPDVDVEICPTATVTGIPTAMSTMTAAPSETPEATPTPMSTIAPAPTSTSDPTIAAAPGVIWLPVALKNTCKPDTLELLVALAIDTSSSMNESSGGMTKLDASKASAKAFIDVLEDFGRGDRAAVIGFDSEARIVVGVSDDYAALRAGIDGIATGEGTRIDAALERSESVLATSMATAPATAAEMAAVIVLLTDGRPDLGSSDDALSAAASAKAAGMTVYSIGLGDDVDAELLRSIATSADHYLPAPDASKLWLIYDDLAKGLPCPDGAIWGR